MQQQLNYYLIVQLLLQFYKCSSGSRNHKTYIKIYYRCMLLSDWTVLRNFIEGRRDKKGVFLEFFTQSPPPLR